MSWPTGVAPGAAARRTSCSSSETSSAALSHSSVRVDPLLGHDQAAILETARLLFANGSYSRSASATRAKPERVIEQTSALVP